MNPPKFAATIFLLASLIVSGQTKSGNTQAQAPSRPTKQVSRVFVPVISPYGSLVALKNAKGKNILKRTSAPWREGYAISYQVAKTDGPYEDRSLFVMGNQIKKDGLTIKRRKSTRSSKVVATSDRALEIKRSIVWDKKYRKLKSELTITNTTSEVLRVSAIEVFIDGQLATHLSDSSVGGIDPGCNPICDDCPPCPCVTGRPCHPGQGLWREVSDPRSLLEDDLIRTMRPTITNPVVSLSWTESNLPQSTLEPGKRMVVRSWIAVPGR